jgi:hypothetical protein
MSHAGIRRVLQSLVAGGLLVLAVDAMATTTLATPFVTTNNGQFMAFVVTNLDKKPIDVTATIADLNGVAIVPIANACTTPLAPQASCGVIVATDTSARCSVTASSSKIRAAINVLTGNIATPSLVTVVPATK